MKKKSSVEPRKLVLHRELIKVLTQDQLTKLIGGAAQSGTSCSTSDDCDGQPIVQTVWPR